MTSLWEFAIDAWRRPGVQTLCLALQDGDDQCTALLLWRAWTVHERRGVDDAILSRAVRTARTWDAAVLRPLRSVRREPALLASPFGDKGGASVRERLLSLEIGAERVLLDALQDLSGDAGGATPSGVEAMIALANAWGRRAPPAMLESLLEALNAEGA